MKLIETNSWDDFYRIYLLPTTAAPRWRRTGRIVGPPEGTERQEDELPVKTGDFGKIYEKYRKNCVHVT